MKSAAIFLLFIGLGYLGVRIALPQRAPDPTPGDSAPLLLECEDYPTVAQAERGRTLTTWAKQVLGRLDAGTFTAVRLTEKDLRDRVREAPVVLVGDSHRKLRPLVALQDAIRAVLESGSHPSDVALLVECLPFDWTSIVDRQSRRGEKGGFARLLRETWPWPVEKLGAVLDDAAGRGIRIAGVGRGTPVSLPDDGKDSARSPAGHAAQMSADDESYIQRVNCLTAARAQAWLEAGPEGRRRVIAFLGGRHVVGPPGAVQSRLRTRGIRSIILYPTVPLIRFKLEEKLPDFERGPWYEIGDGVLYLSGRAGRR